MIGYVLRKLSYDFAPFVLAFVLAPLLEQSLRQSLVMSAEGSAIFLQRPLSLTLLLISGAMMIWMVFKQLTQRRQA